MADCDKNGHFFGIANNCVFLLHSYALSFLVSYCTCVFDFEIPLFSMSWLDYVFSVYMFFFCLAFCLCWFFCTCLFKLLLENMKSEHNMMYTYMIYIYIQYIVYIYMWYYIYMSYIYIHISHIYDICTSAFSNQGAHFHRRPWTMWGTLSSHRHAGTFIIRILAEAQKIQLEIVGL